MRSRKLNINYNGLTYQARSQGFEIGGSDFGHTLNHTQCHTPLIVLFDFILDHKRTDGGIGDE